MPDKNKTGQNEFGTITPEKKSGVITTTENVKNKNLKENSTDQINQNNQQKRTDGDKEREERKNPNNPTFQDAKWTQKKLNEAFDENEDTDGHSKKTPVSDKNKESKINQ